MEIILVDIGSSTVKVYKYSNGKLSLMLQRTLYFKEGFDPENGISQKNKKELFELLEKVKEENKDIPIRLYAIGIFRKLNPETKVNFIDEVFLRTGLYFNIIDQDLENFYLEMALVGKCNLNEPLPCCAIAQAICEKYNIEKIIPSDSNIINGIVRQEFN